MTISSTTRKTAPFVGDGTTTVFPFTFKVFTSADLYVVKSEASTGGQEALTLSTDYSVTLNANQNANPGGEITLGTALAVGYRLVISTNIAPLQEVDLTNLGGFYPQVITKAFDKLTILIQQALETLSRSIRFPISDSAVGSELPTLDDRKGKVLGFHASTGALVALAAVPTSGVLATSYTEQFLTSVNAFAARSALNLDIIAPNPLDYGAVGDGVTEDAAAWQDLIDSGVNRINGLGKTYKVSTTLVLRSNLKIVDAYFDASGLPDGDELFYASGSTGTANLLTANRSRHSLSLPLTSAVAAGDYLLVGSTANYESNTSTKVGEIQRVMSVSGLTANLRDATYSTYNTADTASAKVLTFVENITLENVHATGKGNGTTAGGKDQYGARFIVGKNINLINCSFELFDYAAVEFATCYEVGVSGGQYGRAYDAIDGASYGVMITHGTHHAKITGTTFFDTRHGVTTGGTTAVNRHITVTGCTFTGCRAAGIDNHAGTEIYTWIGNTISAEVGDLSSGTQAAMQSLGGAGVIIGNTVRGSFEFGVICQIFPLGIQCPLIVKGNAFDSGSSSDANHMMVFVEQRNNTSNSGLVVSDNVGTDGWATGIRIAATSADIKYFTISGNNPGLVRTRGIHLSAPTGRIIEHGAIQGNSMRVDSGGSENILLDSTDAAGIEFVTVTGNTTYGGTYGIRGVNTDRIAAAPNVCIAASTANVSVAGANSKTDGTNVTA